MNFLSGFFGTPSPDVEQENDEEGEEEENNPKSSQYMDPSEDKGDSRYASMRM